MSDLPASASLTASSTITANIKPKRNVSAALTVTGATMGARPVAVPASQIIVQSLTKKPPPPDNTAKAVPSTQQHATISTTPSAVGTFVGSVNVGVLQVSRVSTTQLAQGVGTSTKKKP